MKMILTSLLFFLGTFLSFGGCWDAPTFCHEYECPVYVLVNTYEGFEERLYNATQWITTDIASTENNDIKDGFWKLYNFMNKENKEGKTIAMTRPVVVSVHEDGENGENQKISFFITPDTVIPEPTDETIKSQQLPSGIVYVRVFGGHASIEEALENREALRKALMDAGKEFDDHSYMAAIYDSPWDLLNRHNEVWIHTT